MFYYSFIKMAIQDISPRKKKGNIKLFTLLMTMLVFNACSNPKLTNQVHDPDFIPEIEYPEYPPDTGPKVFIDEAHNNFHTMGGRYKPFADLLRKDGFRVFPFKDKFTQANLKAVDILVIANPVHKSNVGNWSLPTPSAFTDSEIEIVNNWVKEGGKLWLIADHMPIPGAAKKLALSFGFKLENGFAYGPGGNSRIKFSREKATLNNHIISNGTKEYEFVKSVYTYTGHAFQIPPEAQSILQFASGSYSLNPQTAHKFDKDTPRLDVSNWSQGAVRNYAKGRVAVFGEAGGFTAQVSGKQRIKWGMNSVEGSANSRFVLNVMHWLSGDLL